MKTTGNYPTVLLLLAAFAVYGCSASRKGAELPDGYVPASMELYREIVKADSTFFDGYNHCKMDVMEAMISSNIEFYHDQGGLSTSKSDLVTALKNNICGKVTRELKQGSIEVYAIPGYGAVEMGIHGFHNNQEPPPPKTRFARFVHIWKKENGVWQLSRVISLH